MLSSDDARRLDRLMLGASREASPYASGARMARARGPGLEFHEFRHYQPGDDLRSIEWSVYERLGQLVVRTCRADAHLRVHVLLDTSRSMSIGVPDKLTCARLVSGLLTYVAIHHRDAVGLATFDEQLRQRIAPAAGRQQLTRVLDLIGASASKGRSSLGAALGAYAAAVRGPGLVVVVSDFFAADGIFTGLRALLHRGLTPAVVQVVADEELEPPILDDVEIVDVEEPDAPPLTVSPAAVAGYRDRVESLTASLGEFCVTRGLVSLRVRSSATFDDLVRACRDAGLLTVQG